MSEVSVSEAIRFWKQELKVKLLFFTPTPLKLEQGECEAGGWLCRRGNELGGFVRASLNHRLNLAICGALVH